MTLSISALATEYILVPVSFKVSGVVTDPTADAVSLAIVATGTTPATGDWHVGSWEQDGTTNPVTNYARLLVGPTGGALTLTAGSTYDVWTKVVDNPETAIARAGVLRAY